MQIIYYPTKESWGEILKRPVLESESLQGAVAEVLSDVRARGDAALKDYARRFDGVELDSLRVTDEEFAEAEQRVPAGLKEAIRVAKANIEKFHAAQTEKNDVIETVPGVFCWRRSVPIEKIGLYVPAGSAPLFSTVLMLAVPARLAGCREIVLCSPPGADGQVNDVTLFAARLCGVNSVFKVGGAQAVGAMAFGTESIPSVYKIFGPGNQYVTEAKQQVSMRGTAIDMPAGPSEVAVLADQTSRPAFVAADLLSQAEHGPDSQVLLVTTSEKVIEETLREVEKQLAGLPRRAIAAQALENSKAILVDSQETALELLNEYAAEHLILAVEKADEAAAGVINAGSVFIGHYSCESAGDYASGTNHTLPTNGFARTYSGVSLDSFVKKITFQRLTADGLRRLGPAIEILAEAEDLHAHKRAVSIRLEEIKRELTQKKSL